MTYFEAISELQQRGIDALKAAQSTQLASLRTSREIAVAATRSVPFTVSPFVSAVSALTTSFTFAVLEAQVAYAKKITDSLATNARPPTVRQESDAHGAAVAQTTTDASASAALEPSAETESMVSTAAAHSAESVASVATVDQSFTNASDQTRVAATLPLTSEQPGSELLLEPTDVTAVVAVAPNVGTPSQPGPHLTEASIAESTKTDLSATVTNHTASHTGAEDTGAGHTLAEDTVTERAVTKHAMPEQALAEHVVSEHAVAEHAMAEQAFAEHVVSEHALGELVTVDPMAVELRAAELRAADSRAIEPHVADVIKSVRDDGDAGAAGTHGRQEPTATIQTGMHLVAEPLADSGSIALGDPAEELLSKTLPPPKAPASSANAARKSPNAPSVSNKRLPRPGSGKK